ncbi:putative ubiquinol-cytochrome c reductase cytochrome c subunit [Mycobacterium xenopi 3993]|nr:putative ubiquinol-cytochrome c reductase cytochrome c subunit [Mycobacterium xenopi 3993]
MRGEAQAPRKDPIFDEAQIEALGAYVQANGGGPPWYASRTEASLKNHCAARI